MRFYRIITETSQDVYRFYGVGKSKSDVKKKYEGNGEFISVEDITDDCPLYPEEVIKAMNMYGFGVQEKIIVEDLLQEYDNAREE